LISNRLPLDSIYRSLCYAPLHWNCRCNYKSHLSGYEFTKYTIFFKKHRIQCMPKLIDAMHTLQLHIDRLNHTQISVMFSCQCWASNVFFSFHSKNFSLSLFGYPRALFYFICQLSILDFEEMLFFLFQKIYHLLN
jgi:hypothetical protein